MFHHFLEQINSYYLIHWTGKDIAELGLADLTNVENKPLRFNEKLNKLADVLTKYIIYA